MEMERRENSFIQQSVMNSFVCNSLYMHETGGMMQRKKEEHFEEQRKKMFERKGRKRDDGEKLG